MKDLERLEQLIGEEFEIDSIVGCFTDKDEYVMVDNTNVKSNFDEYGSCTCWDVFYDVEDSENYHIWVDQNDIIRHIS